MAAIDTISNSEEFSGVPPDMRVKGAGLDASAVSWAAILAGGVAAATLSLVLLLLGVGVGLSTVSPWALDSIDSTVLTKSTILWATCTQLLAAGLGGYLAGRLRMRWRMAPADEVYFRDTAHGFLAWTVATLLTAVLLVSPIASIVDGGTLSTAPQSGALAFAAPSIPDLGSDAQHAQGAGLYRSGDPLAYYLNGLFRKDLSTSTGASTTAGISPSPSPSMTTVTDPIGTTPPVTVSPPSEATSQPPQLAEVGLIFTNALPLASLPAHDARYIAQLVARHTGVTEPEAEARVADAYTRVQDALLDAELTARASADAARRIRAQAAIWLFIALLAGAFIASWLAIYGGRQRDR